MLHYHSHAQISDFQVLRESILFKVVPKSMGLVMVSIQSQFDKRDNLKAGESLLAVVVICGLTRFTGRMRNILRNCSVSGSFPRWIFPPAYPISTAQGTLPQNDAALLVLGFRLSLLLEVMTWCSSQV
jgi:hypothetical protein